MNAEQYKIYSYLIGEMVQGRLAFNSRIEPEIELGKRFDTSRMNAHRAIKQLERRGIVRRNRQEGTIVNRRITAALARELKGDVVKRIGVIRSRNLFEYLHWNDSLLAGLEPELLENGFSLEYVTMDGIDTREKLKAELKRLADDGFSAFILSIRGPDDRFFMDNADILFQYHRNIFVYQSGAEDWAQWPFHTVTVNLFGEGRVAAEYLLEYGYDRIAYCTCDPTPRHWSQERQKGLSFGLRRCSDGKIAPEYWVGQEVIHDNFLAGGKSHVLVGANDQSAALIVDHFRERGLEPGRDFHILGFDDNINFRHYDLTTVAPPHREIGRQLARLILDHTDIDAQYNMTCYLKIDSQIIKRQTA